MGCTNRRNADSGSHRAWVKLSLMCARVVWLAGLGWLGRGVLGTYGRPMSLAGCSVDRVDVGDVDGNATDFWGAG